MTGYITSKQGDNLFPKHWHPTGTNRKKSHILWCNDNIFPNETGDRLAKNLVTKQHQDPAWKASSQHMLLHPMSINILRYYIILFWETNSLQNDLLPGRQIHYLHNPIIHLFKCPPKILHNHCSQVLLGHEDVLRGVKEVYYGIWASSECESFSK